MIRADVMPENNKINTKSKTRNEKTKNKIKQSKSVSQSNHKDPKVIIKIAVRHSESDNE